MGCPLKTMLIMRIGFNNNMDIKYDGIACIT